MRKDQALLLAELEEDSGKKLAEATLTDLELSEDVLEANRSLRELLSELTKHSQSVKSVRLTNWDINASTEIANQSQVQDSRLERKTRPGSLTGVRSDFATEIGRPSVPHLTNSIQPSINHAQ